MSKADERIGNTKTNGVQPGLAVLPHIAKTKMTPTSGDLKGSYIHPHAGEECPPELAAFLDNLGALWGQHNARNKLRHNHNLILQKSLVSDRPSALNYVQKPDMSPSESLYLDMPAQEKCTTKHTNSHSLEAARLRARRAAEQAEARRKAIASFLEQPSDDESEEAAERIEFDAQAWLARRHDEKQNHRIRTELHQALKFRTAKWRDQLRASVEVASKRAHRERKLFREVNDFENLQFEHRRGRAELKMKATAASLQSKIGTAMATLYSEAEASNTQLDSEFASLRKEYDEEISGELCAVRDDSHWNAEFPGILETLDTRGDVALELMAMNEDEEEEEEYSRYEEDLSRWASDSQEGEELAAILENSITSSATAPLEAAQPPPYTEGEHGKVDTHEQEADHEEEDEEEDGEDVFLSGEESLGSEGEHMYRVQQQQKRKQQEPTEEEELSENKKETNASKEEPSAARRGAWAAISAALWWRR